MGFKTVFSIEGTGEAGISPAGKVEESMNPVEKKMVGRRAIVSVMIAVAGIMLSEELPPPRTTVLRDGMACAAKIIVKGDGEEAVWGHASKDDMARAQGRRPSVRARRQDGPGRRDRAKRKGGVQVSSKGQKASI